jgi:glutamate/tyrosine decarboxylase-like PLP-dependent enzyme
MTEFTVHFQKGTRVGARSLVMERFEADTPQMAMRLAKAWSEFKRLRNEGYRLTRVDHFDEDTGRLEIDY